MLRFSASAKRSARFCGGFCFSFTWRTDPSHGPRQGSSPGDQMPAEAAPSQTFAHSGRFFNVLGLALKNAALTVITLTMYRFWARTSMRRRLWSRTWVLGDPLEYTGNAAELFRGFLISLPCFFLPA